MPIINLKTQKYYFLSGFVGCMQNKTYRVTTVFQFTNDSYESVLLMNYSERHYWVESV